MTYESDRGSRRSHERDGRLDYDDAKVILDGAGLSLQRSVIGEVSRRPNQGGDDQGLSLV